jgi:type I restriction enzyme, S subunit
VIQGLRAYPSMKDSGLRWLGEVPEHWDVRRLRDSVDACINGIWGSEPNGREDLPCVRVADFDRQRLRVRVAKPTMRAIAPNERGRRMLAKGDLLLEKSGGGELQPVGVVMLYDHDVRAVCSNFVARMPVAARFNSGYLSYLHAYLYAIRLNVRSIKQTTGIQNLDSSAYLSERIAFPPLPEQSAIACFLDHAGRRIRRFICAKQKLVKLLEEQKQAIIHRAVTRGLDSSVPLTPSGTPWLGDIPQHWEGLQVRRVVSFVTSGSRGWANYYSDDGLIFLQSGNLGRSMSLNLSYIQHVRPPDGAEGERTRVRRNDVLICVTGALTGNVAIVDQDLPAPAFVNQHVVLVRPRQEKIEPRFLAYVLHSEVGRTQFKTNEYGGTKQGLGLGEVKSTFIPVPSLPEQRAICADLDVEVAGFKEAVSRLELEIALLREFRTRLIADVVTGKLDVRDAAVRLPEEAEEAEAPEGSEATTDNEEELENDEEGIAEEAEA